MKRFGFIRALLLALALALLPGRAAALEVGDKAPDFELPSTQAPGKFKLSDFAGKKNVIVQFYVLDFTPT
jgi:thioredoxin-dependent peroxiredoxin